ncbi:MAG: nucleotidyl transferase AbiEii/AbiGii toxin family protein [bacterium]
MTRRRPIANRAASVLARLQNLAREQGVELQLLLSEYAIERFLHRLGESVDADRFVLKGATLFRLWLPQRGRATWDLDLLGRGASDVQTVVSSIRQLCTMPGNEGIDFDPDSVVGESIREPDEYDGVRVRFTARLATSRIPMQLDVGFGDAVTPAPERVEFPTLLNDAPPRILTYPRDTVVAEKLEAVVSLGVTNSRMKDFYDLHRLATTFAFDGKDLARAIRATFDRRGTSLLGEEPVALGLNFLAAAERQVQWRALLRRGRLTGPADVTVLIEDLRRFLLPVLAAAAGEIAFDRRWPPGGPWA